MPTGDPESDVERLFHAALDRPPEGRAAFLDGACATPELRREVESLLSADAEADGFLEPAEWSASPPEQIGPYRLVRKLGEGGMSTVYLAARADGQYAQHVAIKLVRPGMGSRQILRRLRQERQILARLSHPNIARLLDGGSTAAGLPYFVMEYVDGEPLDEHCRRRALPLERLLELFRTICQVVHHAHQNLVVHRDLKPSNILVDALGAPKLLDFGIAKLLGPEPGLTVEPTATLCGPLTPHYASPEQVQGRPVSTASDIYSLGVILYKLVSGRRPYEVETVSAQRMEQIICEANPPPPSQVMAARRGERLPRDLDNIVLMAMRKEPERRYASAQELAEDLRRCLERRPVIARRDTLGYRVSSFLRRNAGGVGAALVVLLSLVIGAVSTIWQGRVAVRERAHAEAEARHSRETLAFVLELFKADPGDMDHMSARELLDRRARERTATSSGDPEQQAALDHTLGLVYHNLGAFDRAAELWAEAVEARATRPSLELADSLYQLGMVRGELGDPHTAGVLLRRALVLREALLGADHRDVADVLDALADVSAYLDRAEADDYSRRALAIRRRHLGEDDPRLARSLMRRASVLRNHGDWAAAQTLFADALTLSRRAPGDNRGDIVDELTELYGLHLLDGRLDDAARDLTEALELGRRTFEPHHPTMVDLRSERVLLWSAQGHFDDAEAVARQSLDERRRLRGEHHPATDHAWHALAAVLLDRGKLAEAEELAVKALAQRERAYGPFHASVVQSLMQVGRIRLERGDAGAAALRFRDALASCHHLFGDEHPYAATALGGLGEALAKSGAYADGRAAAEAAVAMARRLFRPRHPEVAAALVSLATVEWEHDPARAAELAREALSIRREIYPALHPYVAHAAELLDACQLRLAPR